MDIGLVCLKCIYADGRQKSGIRRRILRIGKQALWGELSAWSFVKFSSQLCGRNHGGSCQGINSISGYSVSYKTGNFNQPP